MGIINRLTEYDWASLNELKEVTIPIWLLILVIFFSIRGFFR